MRNPLHRRPRPLPWAYDDGGAAAAGFRSRDDCVARALAIATGVPYAEVRAALNVSAADWRGVRGDHAGGGLLRHEYETWLLGVLGWRWVPTMGIGTGTRVHLAVGELPDVPVVVARVTKHLCAVVDGTVRDNHDPTRDGTRCVYGLYLPPEATP